MTLTSLIKKAQFNWVNADITSANFPDTKLRGKVKIYHFDERIESKEAIKRMEKDGYEPANILELIDWYIKNPKNEDWIVALGSVWQDSGDRLVPYLIGDADWRYLRLRWFDDRWNSYYRFAAIRKDHSKTKELSPDLDSLNLRISALEKKVEKIINP